MGSRPVYSPGSFSDHSLTKPMKQKRPRVTFSEWLFVIWVASLPFVDFYIIGELSIDNLLVPVLFVAFLLSAKKIGQVGWGRLVVVGLIYIVGSAFDHRIIQGGIVPFTSLLWQFTRDASYFFLPLIFITRKEVFPFVNAAVIWVALCGMVSAFLVSLGLLRLEHVRMEASRIGIEALPKVTGVLENFGDVAILSAFAILAALIYEKRELPFKLSTRFGKTFIFVGLFLGLLGTQSRNILLTMIVAIMAFFFFAKLANVKRSRRQGYLIGAFMLLLVGAAIVGFFLPAIMNVLTTMSGGEAAQTALGRLESYLDALALANEAFLSGIQYNTLTKAMLATGIHNFWLGLLLRGGLINVLAVLTLIVIGFRGVLRVLMREPHSKDMMLIGSLVFVFLCSTLFFPANSLIAHFFQGFLLIAWVNRGVSRTGSAG